MSAAHWRSVTIVSKLSFSIRVEKPFQSLKVPRESSASIWNWDYFKWQNYPKKRKKSSFLFYIQMVIVRPALSLSLLNQNINCPKSHWEILRPLISIRLKNIFRIDFFHSWIFWFLIDQYKKLQKIPWNQKNEFNVTLILLSEVLQAILTRQPQRPWLCLCYLQ